MKYTTTSKVTVTENYISHSDLTFLKRDFYFTPCGYVGRLDKRVIYEMVNWIRKQKNVSPSLALRAVCDSALREAVLHGKLFYIKFRKELCDAVLFTKVAIRIPDVYLESVVEHRIAYFE